MQVVQEAEFTLLGLAEVEQMVGHKKSWIYANQSFPQPIKVGGKNMWLRGEIRAWIAALVAIRDARSSRSAGPSPA